MTNIYVGKGVDESTLFGFYEDAEGTKRIEYFTLDSWKVTYYVFQYVVFSNCQYFFFYYGFNLNEFRYIKYNKLC